jgi:hypothetical protein
VKLGLTLKEEERLEVFKNRVLRRSFRPEMEEISWRKVHNGKLHNLYSSLDIRVIKKYEMCMTCSMHKRL